ncbi:hypothetical protein OTERR_13570 [Oryzomicrobium terrae]|uniref:Virulence sensor protein BvgS n=1 Tax=Oryzomicrobium terrae TaxID=1735038 RepID=A0A5C1E7I4_9RHOO|nr:ATP-binding protein [Oryzomicrobium terrae]QEL64833.1 hypothetical protein OTERR_13570 [Oryzomicrobium terrae]
MPNTHRTPLASTPASSRITRRIWGFALLLLGMLWFAIGYKIHLEEKQEIDDTNRSNVNLVRSLEEHTLRTLKSVDQAVVFLKYQYEHNQGDVDIYDYMEKGLIVSTFFNQIGVIDEHGQYILSNLANHKTIDLSDREHFRVHKDVDSKALFISKPVLGRASGKWSIQMTRRINKPDGSFGGVVVVSVDPYYFTNLYSDVDLGKGGVITLAGTDGIIRARKSGDNMTVGQDISGAPMLTMLARTDQGTYTASSKVDGIVRLTAFRRLPDYPMVVAVGVSEREALAGYYARCQAYVVFAVVMSLLILAFALSSSGLLRRLEASRAEAEAATRLKSEFLASMSHELRTPLNGIIGYAELLRDLAPDAEQQVFAATIYDSGNHLLGLVNSILDLSKIEAGKLDLEFADEDCRALVEQVHRTHLPTARQKGLGFEAKVDDAVPATLHCDQTRLIQVLNNLVHNALKFTDQGQVVLQVSRTPQGVRFSVSDTGPGIALADQGAIFEKFRQGEHFITRKHSGTGLGLALSRQLVELMGGHLDVRSAPGEGSEFYFTLSATAPRKEKVA